MKRADTVSIFKAFFFVLLGGFFTYMITSGEYKKYIHVRFIYMLWFAAAMFFILGAFTFFNSFKLRIKKSASVAFMFLLLPLAVFFYSERVKSLSSWSAPSNYVTGSDKIASDNVEVRDDDDELLKKAIEDASKLDEEANVVSRPDDLEDLTSDEGYITKLEYITAHPELEGIEVTVKGLIFTFVEEKYIGRLLMFCCAADAQPVGFFIDRSEKNLKELQKINSYNGWVKVKGSLHFDGKSRNIYLKDIELELSDEGALYVYPEPSVNSKLLY